MDRLNTNSKKSAVLPMLMQCTEPSKIKEGDNNAFIYDPFRQIVEMDMRIVGTRSLKSSMTKIGNGPGAKMDQKNEIDDQKLIR